MMSMAIFNTGRVQILKMADFSLATRRFAKVMIFFNSTNKLIDYYQFISIYHNRRAMPVASPSGMVWDFRIDAEGFHISADRQTDLSGILFFIIGTMFLARMGL